VSEWEPLRPDDAVELLRGLDVPWWIAGGWSLDLFLGYESRPHVDLDVEGRLHQTQERVTLAEEADHEVVARNEDLDLGR